MANIRVMVSGSGFMGREVLRGVLGEDGMEPVGVVEKFSSGDSIALPDGSGTVPLSQNPDALVAQLKPDVIIDFSNAAWTPLVAKAALANGARLVIGTTGQSPAFIEKLTAECKAKGVGAVIAPNFAIGAIVLVHLAKIASKYFDYAEITESHQEKKLDAPSGTAYFIAQEMAAARGKPFEHTMPEKNTLPDARGAVHEGIAIHSQRMPGFVAHHDISFGGLGQTLRLRHDSNGRESFIPGVLLATREVMTKHELIIGLDKLIGL
jgi:4-hydroxy-tetrahydrodipicolinate reductase